MKRKGQGKMQNLQKSQINGKRINSLDIARTICACLVVGVHANLLYDFCEPAGDVVVRVFGRFAVPFFASVTGYFFMKAQEAGKRVFLSNFLSLVRYYLVFSLIYVVWGVVRHEFSGMGSGEILVTIVKRFLFYGIYYHLWFFPCMIVSVVVMYTAFRMKLVKLTAALSAIVCLGGIFTYTWYGTGVRIFPVLERLMQWFDFDYLRRFAAVTIPFSFLGYLILHTKSFWMDGKRDPLLWCCWGASILGDILEIAVADRTGNTNGTVLSFGVIFVVYFSFMFALRYPLYRQIRLGGFCKAFSIVLYGLHPLVLEILKEMKVFRDSSTLLWFCTIMVCGMLYTVLMFLRKRRDTQ